MSKCRRVDKNLEVDVCYLDPPYTSRQYASSYHILETIARYDNPIILGKIGNRADSIQNNSNFSKKREVYNSLDYLIQNLKAKHIFLSYSSDGILTREQIEEILKDYEFELKIIDYNSYQSVNSTKTKVQEYLFYINKEENEQNKSKNKRSP